MKNPFKIWFPPVPPRDEDKYCSTKEQWQWRLKHAKKPPSLIRDAGIMKFIIAPVGTGKDYCQNEEALEKMRRHEHCAIQGGLYLPYDIEKKYYHPFTCFIEVAFKVGWNYYFKDSAIDFDCREWAKTPPMLRHFVNLRRHFQAYFNLNFQEPDQIDKTFVQQCDQASLLSRSWRIIHEQRWKRVPNTDLNGLGSPEEVPRRWEKMDSQAFGGRLHFMRREVWATFNTHDLSMMDSKWLMLSKDERQEALQAMWEKEKITIEQNYGPAQMELLLNG